MEKQHIIRHIITYEVIGFSFLIVVFLVDEFFDLPHYLFGAPATPINVAECLFESVLILIAGLLTVAQTGKLIRKIRILEGILPICASCKKIRNDQGEWTQLEGYISSHSVARFTHGICPDCARELYGVDLSELRDE